MQIDAEIKQIKEYRILGQYCCPLMSMFIKRKNFDLVSGKMKIITEGLGDATYWKINYCPFCGEEITYSETW